MLAEARPRDTAESKAQAAFQVYEFNSAPVIVAEQTPQARAAREIARISTWYGLQGEVTRALDAAGVVTIAGLDDEGRDQLLVRLRLLEDNIQNGGDSPDAPAAR